MAPTYDKDRPEEDRSENEKANPPKAKRAAAAALTYAGDGNVPVVTASGYGKIAEQIVALAFQNGVKVREDADLAQMLAAIEADSAIPTEALIAVAEILAYVYKINGGLRAADTDTTAHPPVIDPPATDPKTDD